MINQKLLCTTALCGAILFCNGYQHSVAFMACTALAIVANALGIAINAADPKTHGIMANFLSLLGDRILYTSIINGALKPMYDLMGGEALPFIACIFAATYARSTLRLDRAQSVNSEPTHRALFLFDNLISATTAGIASVYLENLTDYFVEGYDDLVDKVDSIAHSATEALSRKPEGHELQSTLLSSFSPHAKIITAAVGSALGFGINFAISKALPVTDVTSQFERGALGCVITALMDSVIAPAVISSFKAHSTSIQFGLSKRSEHEISLG